MRDTFRKEYKVIDGETKDNVYVMKSIAENLELVFGLGILIDVLGHVEHEAHTKNCFVVRVNQLDCVAL